MGELVPFRRRRQWTRASDYKPAARRADGGWLAAARSAAPSMLVVALAGFTAVWMMDGPPGADATVQSAAAPLALADSQMRQPADLNRSSAYAAALEAEQPQIVAATSEGAFGASPARSGLSAQFSPCRGAVRTTCVVDGDTIWYQGTKIRVADINAPEVSKPGCAREAMLGDEATVRLTQLLNQGDFALVRPAGTPERDKYGRTLREVHRGGESLGAVLVREGLAEEWGGARIDWC